MYNAETGKMLRHWLGFIAPDKSSVPLSFTADVHIHTQLESAEVVVVEQIFITDIIPEDVKGIVSHVKKSSYIVNQIVKQMMNFSY